MSSNSSSGSLLDQIGGSFFHWIATEILPYLQGSVLSLLVLLGIIMNIILLVIYRKRHLYKDPTNHFIPQMAIVDLTASVAVIIPSAVAAFMKEWPLTDLGCTIHGILSTWFYLLSFAFVVVIFVERVVKAWNTELHESTFNRHSFVVVISSVVWSVDLLVALLPFLGIGEYEFNKYQSQCSLPHQDYQFLAHIHFTLGLYLSAFAFIVCFILLVEKKRRNIVQEINKPVELKAIEAGSGTGKNADAAAKNGPKNAWGKSAGNEKAGGGGGPQKTSREKFLENYNKRMARPKSPETTVSKMFKDSEDEKDHHQAMTAVILWFVLVVCWVWFLVAAMQEMFTDSVWGGWHTLGVLLADVSYCVKPIVYLAHNRHYREHSKETVPEHVREKADAMAKKVNAAVNKMDNAFFKSPGAVKANKFRAALAALAAQRALARWKAKLALKKPGGFAWGKKPAGGDTGAGAGGGEGGSGGGGGGGKPSLLAAFGGGGGGGATPAAPNATAVSATSGGAAPKAANPGQPSIPTITTTAATPQIGASHAQGVQANGGRSSPEGRPLTKSSVVVSVESRATTAGSSSARNAQENDNATAQALNPFAPKSKNDDWGGLGDI